MVKTLRLKNFLSYTDVKISFTDFNVILGANASGKTNLVKGLIVLRDLMNRGYQSLEDFDAFMESVFNKNANEADTLIIEVVIENKIIIDLTDGKKIQAEEHHYKVEMAFGRGVVNETFWIKLKDHSKPFKILDRNEQKARYTNEYDKMFIKNLAITVDEKLFKLIKYQTIAGKPLSGFLTIIHQAYSNFFLTYSLSSGQIINPFFSRNQKVLAPNGSNLSGVLEYYRRHNHIVIESINEILQKNIPNFEYIETKPLGLSENFYFTVREKDGKDYVLNELSQGTDLFIGLITAMVTSQFLDIPEKFKGIMIIEEPEKNLHPQLMGEIVSIAKSLTDRFQIVITTHSTDLVAHCDVEDLLLLDKKAGGTRLRRIKKGKELSAYLQEFSLDQIWLNNDLGGGTVNE